MENPTLNLTKSQGPAPTSYRPGQHLSTATSIIEQFRSAMADKLGILCDAEIIPDGHLHRFAPTDRKNPDAWYVLHLDGTAAGSFGDWRTGFSSAWSARPTDAMNAGERAEYHRQIHKQQQIRDAEQVKIHEEAAVRAQKIWEHAKPAPCDHPYLKKKKIQPHGARVDSEGRLIIPLMDMSGTIRSLERIYPDGQKRFLAGGEKKGLFYRMPTSGKHTGPRIRVFSEGFATACSVSEAIPGAADVVVCFDAGNLHPVIQAFRNAEPGRVFVIGADNDRARPESEPGFDIGFKKAMEAARAENCAVTMPGTPGQDFNDLAAAEGLDRVRALILDAEMPPREATTAGDVWPEPDPLTPTEKSEPYPLDALPVTIRNAVKEVSDFVQCPTALAACSCLAALSTVGGGLVDVKRAEGLTGPSTLYFLVVADSGERKTSSDRFFSDPIRAFDTEAFESCKPQVQTWKANHDAWEAEKGGLLQAIKNTSKANKDTSNLKMRLERLQANEPESPMVPQLMLGDATTEALIHRLALKYPIGGLLSNEAGVIFGGHAMGKDSLMRTLSTLNSLWDGQSMSIDRRTSESYRLESARLSLGLGIQEHTLREFVAGTNGLARGSGFLARFLVAWPESTQGKRMFQDLPAARPALREFEKRFSDILASDIRLIDGRLTPIELELSKDAKSLWVNAYDVIEKELSPCGELADVRDVASKAADNIARLAAIFHVFQNGPDIEKKKFIGRDHIERAGQIINWHLLEARRFLGQVATPAEITDAADLESWLLERCRTDHTGAIPIHQIQKSGPYRLRKKKPLDDALRELEEAGRVRRVKAGHKGLDVQVNPALIKK